MPDKLGDRARVLHVLDAIDSIVGYVQGIDFEDFVKNSMMNDACIRQLGVIGEACNRISKETQLKYPQIEWRQIIGLRNIVIHQYFGVDDRVIWDIIQESLPSLRTRMSEILDNLS